MKKKFDLVVLILEKRVNQKTSSFNHKLNTVVLPPYQCFIKKECLIFQEIEKNLPLFISYLYPNAFQLVKVDFKVSLPIKNTYSLVYCPKKIIDITVWEPRYSKGNFHLLRKSSHKDYL